MMRFILSEYLSSLKEDKELDSFIEELAKSMRLIPTSKIQKGRQFGVDVSAVGTDEDGIRKLFLFVIKQGNFSRQNWDNGDINHIRPSITEIFDVYMQTRIVKPYDQLPIKIIVACNGYLEQTVVDNWTNFVNKSTTEKITFDFWGIDKLTAYAEEYQMQEEVLSRNDAFLFRRSLYFIDLPDYNLSMLYKFIDGLLPDKENTKLNDKQIFKKLRLTNLCIGIISKWCEKSENMKPAYIASEYIILGIWKWITKNQFTERKHVFKEYCKILKNWKDLHHKYLNRVFEYFKIPDGLSLGVPSHNEYCLLTFEQIGIVSMIGLYQHWETTILINEEELIESHYKDTIAIIHCLAHLIENNPSSVNPKYDEHCIDIELALVLLCNYGMYNVAIKWLRKLVNRLIINNDIDGFIPLLHSEYEKLNKGKSEPQETSFLIPILAEWCIILKQNDAYKAIREFIEVKSPKLNLQMWFPTKELEDCLYQKNANNNGSTMINIELPSNRQLLEMNMSEERHLLNEENELSYRKYGLLFIDHLASRHFRTYPFPNNRRNLLSTKFCF